MMIDMIFNTFALKNIYIKFPRKVILCVKPFGATFTADLGFLYSGQKYPKAKGQKGQFFS